jgi:hypothetical protein
MLKLWVIAPWIILILANLCFVIWYSLYRPLWENLGITGSAAVSVCAVIATLSGALLGFIIALISLTTQFVSSGYFTSKDAIAREIQYLGTWLKENSFKQYDNYQNLAQTVDNLRGISRAALIPKMTDKTYDEWANVIHQTWESLESFIKSNAVTGKLGEEPDAKENQDRILPELDSAVINLFNAMARMRIASITASIYEYLVSISYLVGFILIAALTLLVLSGMQSWNSDLLIDSTKLWFVIGLIFSFASPIISIFFILNTYMRIMKLSFQS